MTNYLILYGNTQQHYFYKPYDGICKKEKKTNFWGNHEIIYKEGLDNFCVYADKHNNIHIVCSNAQHEIVYLLYRNDKWTKYILTKSREGVVPITFKLLSARGHLNLFYSAEYNHEIILVHCVMGINSQPATIGKLLTNNFFLFNEKVYYTNENNVLGYQDFSDGKPDAFTALHENGAMPYLVEDGGKEYMVWKRKNQIILGDATIFEDVSAQNPIFVRNESQILILWKSGDFVRYITSFNGGATWSSPMRFVNPNKNAELYFAQQGNRILYFYGNHSNTELNILGKSEVFSGNKQGEYDNMNELPQDDNSEPIEIRKLKIMLEIIRNEIIQLKKQVISVKEEIEKMK